ncbi:MAG: tetratricopeptide repeat protein [Terriglobales bacterium]
MRSLVLSLALLVTNVASAFAQGPPLNGTPEQLFDAGMNALSGSVGTRDNFSAVEYFRRAARKGYVPAQVVLGSFYDTGQIVAGDPGQAADWYRKAAEAGDPLAQWLLGRLYFIGSGLPQDYAAAQKWLTLAANQNNPFAACLLGRVMLDRDYTKAPYWFRVAAEQGLPQAQYQYARAWKEGRGVAQDQLQAYVWFLVALDASYSAAQNELCELEGALSRDQIDQAKAEARKLEESVSRQVAAHGCTGWDGEFNETPAPPPVKIQRFCR